MFEIGLEVSPSNRPPSKLDRAKVLFSGGHSKFVGLFRGVAEKLRRISKLGKRLTVSQQFPDRFPARFSQYIPQRNFHARPSMRGLQQVHAVQFDLVGDL